MSCRVCGAELPERALFCGRCGRSVAAQGAPAVAPQTDRLDTLLPQLPRLDEFEEIDAVAPAGVRCQHCDSPLEPGSVFCGECGLINSAAVLSAVPAGRAAAEAAEASPWAPEAHVPAAPAGVAPAPVAAPETPHAPVGAEQAPAASDSPAWPGWASAPPAAAHRDAEAQAPAREAVAEPMGPDADALGESDAVEPAPDAGRPALDPLDELTSVGAVIRPEAPSEHDAPSAQAAGFEQPASVEHAPAAAGALHPAAEAAPAARRVPAAASFVLQFSTGESVLVSGSGLVGRNPVPQPGENFEDYVVIVDGSKSVSKTHLEFGQDESGFWVSDRFSTNGSVVRAVGMAPVRCEPGRRYRVDRGSRIDIGDQFFVVS